MDTRKSTRNGKTNATQAISNAVETLECRRHLSATLSTGGELLVTGTERADAITVGLGRNSKLVVSVNRVRTEFDLPAVTGGITIRSLGGNDKIVVGPNVGLDVSVFAGAGNDRIVLSSGDDVVDAGAGNDSVDAGAGDDFVLGGEGNDDLKGRLGDDDLFGDNGNDRVEGNEGDDACVGGNGNDALGGGQGDDDLDGGIGNDAMSGGVGDDSLDGDNGNDNLDGGAGDDRLDGGSQNDKLSGRDGDDDLFGDDGVDVIRGGRGDDFVDGGNGSDNCRGEDGDDTFSKDDDDREHGDRGKRGEDDVEPTLETLPAAVLSTLDREFPGYTLLKLKSEDDAGDDVVTHYEMLVSASGKLCEVKINVDGTIRSIETEDSAPVTFDGLPAPVKQHFNTNFPNATILKVDSEDSAGNGVVDEFEIKFNFTGKLYEVKYSPSGEVLKLEIDGEDEGEGEDDGDRNDDD